MFLFAEFIPPPISFPSLCPKPKNSSTCDLGQHTNDRGIEILLPNGSEQSTGNYTLLTLTREVL